MRAKIFTLQVKTLKIIMGLTKLVDPSNTYIEAAIATVARCICNQQKYTGNLQNN